MKKLIPPMIIGLVTGVLSASMGYGPLTWQNLSICFVGLISYIVGVFFGEFWSE